MSIGQVIITSQSENGDNVFYEKDPYIRLGLYLQKNGTFQELTEYCSELNTVYHQLSNILNKYVYDHDLDLSTDDVLLPFVQPMLSELFRLKITFANYINTLTPSCHDLISDIENDLNTFNIQEYVVVNNHLTRIQVKWGLRTYIFNSKIYQPSKQEYMDKILLSDSLESERSLVPSEDTLKICNEVSVKESAHPLTGALQSVIQFFQLYI